MRANKERKAGTAREVNIITESSVRFSFLLSFFLSFSLSSLDSPSLGLSLSFFVGARLSLADRNVAAAGPDSSLFLSY